MQNTCSMVLEGEIAAVICGWQRALTIVASGPRPGMCTLELHEGGLLKNS